MRFVTLAHRTVIWVSVIHRIQGTTTRSPLFPLHVVCPRALLIIQPLARGGLSNFSAVDSGRAPSPARLPQGDAYGDVTTNGRRGFSQLHTEALLTVRQKGHSEYCYSC